MGTSKGLCKHDGYEVRGFPEVDGPNNVITSIVKMDDGSLLLATWNGLWTFDPVTERSTQFLLDVDFHDRRIDALARNARGRIWIGSRSQGLCEHDPTTGSVKRYTTQSGLILRSQT